MDIRPGHDLLYLARADVLACGIAAAEVNAAVEAAFLARARGRAFTKPKITITQPGGASFRAKGGVITDPPYAAVKWFGYFPGNEAHALPDFWPLILLNEARTGMPIALIDATWISAVRTASISAVAAKYMARPESRSIGFVACGSQARSNLAALRAEFPIARITAYSRRRATAERFAEEARAEGLAAEAVAEPRDAVVDADIVVTSVPHQSPENRFLDAAWLAPGSFAAMVDMGFSWQTESLAALDRVVTDDLEQSGPGGSERLNFAGTYAGEIADLVAGRQPGRATPDERSAVVFSGTGLADTAAALIVYERALARNLGQILAL